MNTEKPRRNFLLASAHRSLMLSAAVTSVSLCFPRGTHAQFEIIEKLFGRVSEFTLFLDAGRLTNTDDVTSVQDLVVAIDGPLGRIKRSTLNE